MALGDAPDLAFTLRVKGGDAAAAEVKKVAAEIKSAAEKSNAAVQNIASSLPGGNFLARFQAIKTDIDAITRAEQLAAGSTGRLGTAVEALGGASVIAGAGIASAGLAAVGLAAALAHTVSVAAEAGDKFADLSNQSGVSVETLSGLQLSLEQNNASVETLANGLFFLTKNQGAAKDGNAELAASFRRLGVDLNAGPDVALRQVIAGLRQIPDLATRNELGAKVMGRGYKELALWVNNASGSIDEIIEKARAAGLVMSGETARAADELKDHIAELTLRTERLEASIGNALIPDLNLLGRALGESKGGTDVLGVGLNYLREQSKEATGGILATVAAVQALKDAAQGDSFATAFGRNLGELAAAGVGPSETPKTKEQEFIDKFKTQREELQKQLKELSPAREILAGLQFDIQHFGDKSNVARVTEQFQKLRERLAEAGTAFSDEAAAKFEEWERESIRQAGALDALIRKQKEKEEADKKARAEAEQQSGVIRGVSEDYKEAALRVQLYGQNALQLEAVLYRLAKGYSTLSDENKKLADAEIDRLFNSKQALQFLEKNQDIQKNAAEILKAQAQALGQVESPLAAVHKLLLDNDNAVADLSRKFGKDLPAGVVAGVDASTEKLLRMNALILQIKQAMESVGPENVPVGIPGIASPVAGTGMPGPWVDPATVEAPPPPNLDLWHEAIKGLKDASKDAFGGITQGFGGMIYAFLTGEKSAAKSFGAIAKAAAASVSAEAGVRALFEFGMFLATLFTNPVEAQTHLLASETFGLVALGAGAAALAIPGGGASQGSAFGGGAGSSFGGGGFGSSTQDNGPRVIEQSRNTVQQQVIILRVESNDSHIINVVHKDVRSNGPTRNLIIETAAA